MIGVALATSGEGGMCLGGVQGGGRGRRTRFVRVLSGGGPWVHACFFNSSLNDSDNYSRSFVCNDICPGKSCFRNK